MKQQARRLLTSDPAVALMRPLAAGVATILMCHRFADAELGNAGDSPALLRENLAYLRRSRRELISLGELIRRLDAAPDRVGGAVVFTVDDGYRDFARVAAPVFAEFDCPVTVFVVTGAMDGHDWYWRDRLDVAISTAPIRSLAVEIGAALQRYQWRDAPEAMAVARAIAERLKRVRDAERRRVLADIESRLQVDLPARPPDRFAAMTWDDVRQCSRRGVTFGPHTVSHPILAQLDDEQSAFEMLESWRRVRAETDAAVAVFCYPNGGPDDFTDRECRVLQREGFAAGVTAVQEYVGGQAVAAPLGRFRLPRFPYYQHRADFLQVISGLERAMRPLRRLYRRPGQVAADHRAEA